jgi:hypothetical protein
MLVTSLIAITTNLIVGDYDKSVRVIGTLLWVGVAFMAELRCIKLQKQIDKLNGNN